jgi:hypothetical protein
MAREGSVAGLIAIARGFLAGETAAICGRELRYGCGAVRVPPPGVAPQAGHAD